MSLRIRALSRIPLVIGIVAAVVTALLAFYQQPIAGLAVPVSHRPAAVRMPVTRHVAAPPQSSIVLRSGDTLDGLALRSPAPVAGRGAAAAVGYALAQLGVPYRWGGAGNGGFDCSGLVMRAWEAGGVQLPHNAAAQAHAGVRITRDQLRPGDLVLSNGFGHVQLYIGGGQVVEAPHTGAVVRITALPSSAQVDAYVRISA